uniref:manganese catalase family protein n=1 Tax=Staphylococcus aureus TaxID=1280 RepID=UPI0015C5FA3A
KLSGVSVGKLLPIPDISNKRFPESKKHEDAGLHRIMYRFSADDYKRVGEVWNGEHPEDGGELEVVDGIPEGAVPPDLDAEPQLCAPGGPDESDLNPEMLEEYARRIFGTGIKDDIKRRKDAEPATPRKSKKN